MRRRIHPRRIILFRRVALALAVLFAVAVVVPATAASPADAASSRWAWTSSIRVPHYVPSGFSAMSCPTSTLCVAVNDNLVLTSTKPTVAKSWTSAALEPRTSPYLVGGDVTFDDVDCASAHFCAAVDDLGQIFTTTEPTAGPPAWSAQTLNNDTVAELTDVSCASATACVALTYTGAAYTLTPTGWQRAQLTSHEGRDNTAVSCASATLCAAVVGDGRIYTIDPSVGGDWNRAKFGKVPHGGWDSIDCPSATTCVAVGNDEATGVVAVTTTPTASSWKSATLKAAKGGLYIVSCRSASFCVIAGDGKDFWTTKPSVTASSWHAFAPHSKQGYSQVSATCFTSKECFIADIGDKIAIGHRR